MDCILSIVRIFLFVEQYHSAKGYYEYLFIRFEKKYFQRFISSIIIKKRAFVMMYYRRRTIVKNEPEIRLSFKMLLKGICILQVHFFTVTFANIAKFWSFFCLSLDQAFSSFVSHLVQFLVISSPMYVWSELFQGQSAFDIEQFSIFLLNSVLIAF